MENTSIDLWKVIIEKKHSFHNKNSFEVLCSLALYILPRFVFSLKTVIMLIPPHMHKTIPTLRNKKEQ